MFTTKIEWCFSIFKLALIMWEKCEESDVRKNLVFLLVPTFCFNKYFVNRNSLISLLFSDECQKKKHYLFSKQNAGVPTEMPLTSFATDDIKEIPTASLTHPV